MEKVEEMMLAETEENSREDLGCRLGAYALRMAQLCEEKEETR